MSLPRRKPEECICKYCGVLLVVGENWTEAKKRNYSYWCTSCHLAKSSEWKRKNPERMSALRKNRYSKNAEKFRQEARDYRGRCQDISRYSQYKSGAKRRGLDFDLTYLEFMMFWQKPCQYCGSGIATIGIDRIDNTKGYSINNIVSCCDTCNWMKADYALDSFMEHCKKIVEKNYGNS